MFWNSLVSSVTCQRYFGRYSGFSHKSTLTKFHYTGCFTTSGWGIDGCGGTVSREKTRQQTLPPISHPPGATHGATLRLEDAKTGQYPIFVTSMILMKSPTRFIYYCRHRLAINGYGPYLCQTTTSDGRLSIHVSQLLFALVFQTNHLLLRASSSRCTLNVVGVLSRDGTSSD
jgi:hypothetical protein